MKEEICHVCGKEKKQYTVFMNQDIFSLIKYNMAREDGPICERCDQYYAMTGEFKDATKQEFENAKKSVWFARMMLRWWEQDKKLDAVNDGDSSMLVDFEATELKNKREWGGTEPIAKWCRGILNKEDEVKIQGDTKTDK